MIKISIITAVRNRVNVIANAIESVSGQSYHDIEHLIQDGLSTDGTLEVIGRYNSSIIRLESKRDSGIYDAINKGILRAQGDVIGLMHSDDFFADPLVLAKVAEAFQDPDVDGVYGDLDYVDSADTRRVLRRWRSGSFAIENLRRGWMPPHPTVYLRSHVFKKWGVYDTSYRISADYDAMLRYLSMGEVKMTYIPEVIVKMRTGGESNKSLYNLAKKSCEDYRAIRTNKVGGFGTLLQKNLSKIHQFT